MAKNNDEAYIGMKFNKLTVMGQSFYEFSNGQKRKAVVVKCDCGVTKVVSLYNLINNKVKSCGCLIYKYPHSKIGDRFSKLTIVSEPFYKKCDNNKRKFVEVKCDCGNIKTASLYDLTNNKIKSCGCSRQKRSLPKKGDRFNYLTVIEDYTNKNKDHRILCQCDCKQKNRVDVYKLMSGRIKSCGCLAGHPTEIKKGYRFGGYTIISDFYHKNNRRYYKIKCLCGAIREKTANEILKCQQCKKCSGHQSKKYKAGDKSGSLTFIKYLEPNKSSREYTVLVQCNCGKIKRVKTSGFKRSGDLCCCDKSTKNIPSSYYNKVKGDARRRGRKFDITIKYIDELLIKQNHKCNITKININRKDRTASLDRIDSNKGYIVGNVQWLHRDINIMKLNHEQDYFIYLCNLVSKNNKKDDGE